LLTGSSLLGHAQQRGTLGHQKDRELLSVDYSLRPYLNKINQSYFSESKNNNYLGSDGVFTVGLRVVTAPVNFRGREARHCSCSARELRPYKQTVAAAMTQVPPICAAEGPGHGQICRTTPTT